MLLGFAFKRFRSFKTQMKEDVKDGIEGEMTC